MLYFKSLCGKPKNMLLNNQRQEIIDRGIKKLNYNPEGEKLY